MCEADPRRDQLERPLRGVAPLTRTAQRGTNVAERQPLRDERRQSRRKRAGSCLDLRATPRRDRGCRRQESAQLGLTTIADIEVTHIRFERSNVHCAPLESGLKKESA